jgi:thiol-disulfide isomerase/thioredoxin
MDRLSAVIGLAALACACGNDKDASPTPSRVNGAKVATNTTGSGSVEAFCDARDPGDKGPLFQWPALAAAPPAAAPSWRWVNVWATWCKPCIEELPRIVKWHDKLVASGKQVDLQFVSVDESEADVTEFRKNHTDAPASMRMADPEKKMSPWFKELGLGEAPPVPIHVFVGPAGHIRCARAGAVREQDYAVVERVLSE